MLCNDLSLYGFSCPLYVIRRAPRCRLWQADPVTIREARIMGAESQTAIVEE
jgi:hypothetical protein